MNCNSGYSDQCVFTFIKVCMRKGNWKRICRVYRRRSKIDFFKKILYMDIGMTSKTCWERKKGSIFQETTANSFLNIAQNRSQGTQIRTKILNDNRPLAGLSIAFFCLKNKRAACFL